MIELITIWLTLGILKVFISGKSFWFILDSSPNILTELHPNKNVLPSQPTAVAPDGVPNFRSTFVLSLSEKGYFISGAAEIIGCQVHLSGKTSIDLYAVRWVW